MENNTAKERMTISFSGGRTSGFMTKYLLDNYSDKYEFQVVFANTGCEHPKTLEFINNCDKHFGFNTTWVEAVVNPQKGKGTTHKIVTFETAARNGEPYEEVTKKYGISNKVFQICNRELKLSAMRSYLRSIGWKKGEYYTAIGIRDDETRRVSKNADAGKIIYPLVDLLPTDKIDVLNWWSEQPFDLEILEHQGNCTWCWKKSLKKHMMLIEENPEFFDFPRRMEQTYRDCGVERDEKNKTFFRMGLSTDGLFKVFELHKESGQKLSYDMEANGGCSESCEMFEMDEGGGQ